MEEDEILIFFLALAAVAASMMFLSTAQLHKLYLRERRGIGLVRAAVLLGMLYILFVLLFFSDESVTPVYVLFYLVMGLALVGVFGVHWARLCGFRYREDVGERGNFAAAIAVAGFTLATAILFGGSLWGEADPDGDDEGGWWIPLGFFLAGWAGLVLAGRIYTWRQPVVYWIRQERDERYGRTSAAFLISSAIMLHEGVAGDFYGWGHGLLSVGVIVGMLVGHEVFGILNRALAAKTGRRSDGANPGEAIFYLVMGGAGWAAHRIIDAWAGVGG